MEDLQVDNRRKGFTVVKQNKHARVLSYTRGTRYVVQEWLDNQWIDLAVGHGSAYKPVALHVYKLLTENKS